MAEIRYASVAAWAVDFVRAVRQRPLWARILLRVVLGRYAYREFLGLVNGLQQNDLSPCYPYTLEKMEYHRDVVSWDWAAIVEDIYLSTCDKPQET